MKTIRTPYALILVDSIESFKVEFVDAVGETPIWVSFRSGSAPVSLGMWENYDAATAALGRLQHELSLTNHTVIDIEALRRQ